MNYHHTYQVTDLLLTFGMVAVWTAVTAGGSAIGARRLQLAMAESELNALARALKLTVDGRVLRGARRGVLIRLERHGTKGNDLGAWQVELLDPQGPAGLDLGREGFVRLPSGADVALGDRAFDEVVYVATDDLALALASLPPSSRETVRDGVRQGWVRHGASWRLRGVGAVSEMVEIAIEQGLRLCTCLRSDGVGMRHRLRMRCADPMPEVAAGAIRVRFDKGWLEDDELPPLLHHRDPDLAVRAALALEDLEWLSDTARRSAGLELRLRATLALHELRADERLPPSVEALLLRGVRGQLRIPCLEALAELGGERALAELEGVEGGSAVRARIQTRRSRRIGGVALAEDEGGGLALAEADPG